MRNKLTTQLKKRLSLLLAVVMVLSMGVMMDWTDFVPKANAASGGNYSVRVYMNNYDTDSDTDFMWTKCYGHDQQGNSGTICDSAYFDEATGSNYYAEYSTPYFPTSFNSYWESHNCDKSSYGCTVYIQVYYNGGWQNVMSASMSSNSNKTGNATYSCSCNSSTGTRPSVNSVSITGGGSQSLSGNYKATLTSSAISARAYDQFGVQWYQYPTWSTSADTISTTGNSASVTLKSTSYSDHSSTVTASLGGKSASTTVSFKWKHRLTVTNAGNGTSGTFDDFSGNTKSISAGSRTGYDFSSWTKGGTGTLSSTSSASPTWTFGNGDGTLTCNWTIHTSTLKVNPNSGTWDGNTTQQSYTQNYNTTKLIPLPTKAGWTFTGWTQSSPFYGSGFNANAQFTYTFPADKGVTSTITATWKRDITNTYHYYLADATTDKTATASGTAYNTATTLALTSPSVAPATIAKNDKTWTLKGWNESSATVWGTSTATANVGIGVSHDVATTSSSHTFYPVYALATTKFYANFNYYEDEATTYSTVTMDKTVEFDAQTGAMPVAAVTNDGANDTIPRYYTKSGYVYELQGWSKTSGATTVDVAYNGGTISLNVPGYATAAPTTSTANLTPIELYPVYTQYATAIHVHFNYYDANGNLTFKDVSGRAMGTATTGDVVLPDQSLVTTSYVKKNANNENVTYKLVGWSAANNSEDYTAFNGTITLAVKPNPATDYYTYYPVYEVTTTSRYYYYDANGAQQHVDKTETLLKTDSYTPTTATVAVPLTDFGKTFTLDSRTFTFCGWRNDTTSAAATIATTVASESHTIRDAEYPYYAVYMSADLALSYNTTHDGITATPAPATQKQTQYLNCGTAAAANTNNATELTYTIAPNGEVPAKTGYTFKGWDLTDSEDETAAYSNGGSIAIKKNTTLYARFTVNKQKVTFVYYDVNAEGGVDSAFTYDERLIPYDDELRDDSNYNSGSGYNNNRYVVTAPTVKLVGSNNYINSENIAHASDKYHYVFDHWTRSDGKGACFTSTNGLSFVAKFKNVTEDITIQAYYKSYPHHYTNMTTAQFAAAGITGDTAPSKEATCTEDGYQYMICADCGHAYKKPIFKLEHKDKDGNISLIYSGYQAATCTETGTYFIASCRFCGEVVMTGEGENAHPVYYDYVDDAYVEADSTTGVIPALGHDYQYTETVAPTCTEKGYKLYVCANDPSHTEKRDETPFTGHTIETIDAKDPTCTEDGYTVKQVCSVCNRVIKDSYIVPALGHEIVKHPAKAVTCLEDGNEEYYECERCGNFYADKFGNDELTAEEVEALTITAPGSHAFEYSEAAEATCTTPGHTAGAVCSRCGFVQSEETITEPALGHKYENEGAVVHTDSDKPCKTPGYTTYTCDRCGESYTEDDALADHDPIEVDAVPATCTTMGKTAYTKCRNCDEVITNFSWIPKTDHNYSIEMTAEEPADCTNPGATASMKCSICGDVKAAEEIAALGHNFSSWIVTTAASCNVAGEKTRYCKRCGATETQAIEALEHDYEDVAAVEATCYSVGHTAGQRCKNCGATIDIVEEQMKPHELTEVDRPATCTLSGLTIKQCVNYAICGYEEEIVTDALGHDYQDDPAVPSVEPTCADVGYTAGLKCARCGDTKAPEVVAKVDHDMIEAESIAPTCTEPGMTSYKYCRFCGLHMTDPREIPATGHQYNEQGWILDHARTCTEDGLRVRYCDVEGCPAHTAIVDEEAQTMVLPKLGHNMTKVEAVAAKCGVAGNVEYYVCSRCEGIYYGDVEGNTTLDEIVIPALEHEWRPTEVVAPTCTLKGYTIETCNVEGCGATRRVNETDKIPHTGGTATCKDKAICEVCGQPYGGYSSSHKYVTEVITEPTCTQQGVEKLTCSVCGKSYESVIPKEVHKAEIVVISEPTCTEPGTYKEVCKWCGITLADGLQTPPTGHSDADGNGVCDNCGEPMSATPADPGASNKCDKCGKDHQGKTGGFFGYDGFVCKLIAFFRMIAKLFGK